MHVLIIMADSTSSTENNKTEKEETNSTQEVQQKSHIPSAEFVVSVKERKIINFIHYRVGVAWYHFQEDVDKFMQEPRNSSATAVMRRFEEQHAKYKLFEANIFEKKKRYWNTITVDDKG